MDMISEIKEVKTRKFAHITKSDNKVVNIFDWSEEIDPNLGESNLLLDISNFAEEAKIGDIYDGQGFSTPEIEEVKEEKPVKEDVLSQINNLLTQLQEKINKL
jgi:hypothetical protein